MTDQYKDDFIYLTGGIIIGGPVSSFVIAPEDNVLIKRGGESTEVLLGM